MVFESNLWWLKLSCDHWCELRWKYALRFGGYFKDLLYWSEWNEVARESIDGDFPFIGLYKQPIKINNENPPVVPFPPEFIYLDWWRYFTHKLDESCCTAGKMDLKTELPWDSQVPFSYYFQHLSILKTNPRFEICVTLCLKSWLVLLTGRIWLTPTLTRWHCVLKIKPF